MSHQCEHCRRWPVWLGVPLWLLAAGVLGVSAVSGATDLKGIADPTRPPPGVLHSATAASGAASGAAASDARDVEDRPKPVVLELQAIRYRADTGHAVAVINDEVVEVGDKVAGMRVMAISPHGAELKGSAGVRRLTLRFDVIESESDPQPKGRKVGAVQSGRKESQ